MRLRTIPTLAGFIVLIALTGCGHTPAQESAPPLANRAADHALAMVGKPYRYGGNTPKGFDCSGLVQYSYARVGVKLPHGTRHLLQVSQPVSRNKLKRGDLVFFTQEGKRSSHVALYLGRQSFRACALQRQKCLRRRFQRRLLATSFHGSTAHRDRLTCRAAVRPFMSCCLPSRPCSPCPRRAPTRPALSS